MTSLLCVQQPGGTLRIHNHTTASPLLQTVDCRIHMNMHSRSSSSESKSISSAKSCQSSMSSHKGKNSSCEAGSTENLQNWLNSKSVKELQDRSGKETRSTRKLLSSLLEGEKTFVKYADDYLTQKSMLELRKKELLHKRWSDNVYQPLRAKINKEMDSSNWPDVDRRKREMHKQYLEFCNRKGHVFLDIIDPEDYYPMALNGHRPSPLLIATNRLRDPLLSQCSQRNEEERTVLRCTTGNDYTDRDIQQIKLPLPPLVPLGRHGTECATWLSMPYNNIESTSRQASRRRMRNKTGHQMDFWAWANAPFDPAVVDMEMQTQKRGEGRRVPFERAREDFFVDVGTCTTERSQQASV